MSQNKVEILHDRYEVGELLGSGVYGTVYKVYDQKSKQHFAMKVENYTGRVQREIDCLKRVKYEEGFLRLKEYFTEDWNEVHLIFTLVGTTLHDLLKRVEINGKKCDLKTVLMIADQLLDRLEVLHAAEYVHRDLKTDNLAMGIDGDEETLYLLDLGLVKRITTDDRTHIRKSEGHNLMGNSRYCSLHSHKGYTLSRRDDLESMGYLLIRMLKGKLPWSAESDYDDIYQFKKRSTSILCKGLEPEFRAFLKYAKGLEFKTNPDYKYCRKLFSDLFKRKGYVWDAIYAWTLSTENDYIAAEQLEKRKREAEEKRQKGLLEEKQAAKEEQAAREQQANEQKGAASSSSPLSSSSAAATTLHSSSSAAATTVRFSSSTAATNDEREKRLQKMTAVIRGGAGSPSAQNPPSCIRFPLLTSLAYKSIPPSKSRALVKYEPPPTSRVPYATGSLVNSKVKTPSPLRFEVSAPTGLIKTEVPPSSTTSESLKAEIAIVATKSQKAELPAASTESHRVDTPTTPTTADSLKIVLSDTADNNYDEDAMDIEDSSDVSSQSSNFDAAELVVVGTKKRKAPEHKEEGAGTEQKKLKTDEHQQYEGLVISSIQPPQEDPHL